ncbi:hypothetical protein KVR01_000105 [Diaporthe batatas]|uniref:uncharacterized protein n=1 Tax=Diaporthe batatas TaxID=748121 RepID=UPI001D0493E4|nr:uncharacterized protein KVR01_000105 [Diaporthe batatas]KAG8169360.1 hypothetical protein KVR01_000105 [Diaporthe batatas]
MPRSRKQTRPARQYARPGCSYELPICIDNEEQVAPKKTNTNQSSNHTASWMEALAKGRWEGGANRPTVEGSQAQGSRKRTNRDVDEDNEEPRNGGAKRLRLSGGDSHAKLVTPTAIHQPLPTPNHPTKTVKGQAKNNLRAPRIGVRTRPHQIEQENSEFFARNNQVAVGQTSPKDDEEQALDANPREQQYQPAPWATLHTMWQDHDRQLEAAKERLRITEQEEREKAERQAREREEERLGEIGTIEASIRSMWEADPLDERGDRKIRLGLSAEAGLRRFRERQEMMRQNKF